MAEKKKDSSFSKSMEKTSLLDLDIGKDFLTSWKSMSVTEDDPMDFDFSKVTKGNKEAFKFDNLDMDFNLGNDFGKISSFSVDIPDLDVSSPVKNFAKPDEKPKKVSTDVKTQGKLNESTFQFDFNQFEYSSFGQSSTKKAKQTNANQDELSLSTSGSPVLKETTGASEGKTTPKSDSQLCGEPDPWSKEKLQTPLVEVQTASNSEFSKDQATNMRATTSPQKPISNCKQETFQNNCPKERITSIEPNGKDKCPNSSVQSVFENSSTHQTASYSQEQVDCLAGKERTNTGSEQSLFHDKTDLGMDCWDSQIDKFPADIAGLQSNDGENIQFSVHNNVQVDNRYNAKPGQDDSQFEQTSTSAPTKVFCETEADEETTDLTSEPIMQLNSETAGGGREMSGPKCVTKVVMSKYFKGSDEAKSQLQQLSLSKLKTATFDRKMIEAVQLRFADKGGTVGDNAMPDEESLPNIRSENFKELDDTKSIQQESLSQLKVGAIGSQRFTTSQPCTGDERKLDNKSKFVSLPKSRPLSREQTKVDTINVRSQGTPSNQTSNRGGFDSYDARNFLTNTSKLRDMDVARGEAVKNGIENNAKDPNTFSSHVETSSLNEKANGSASLLGLNPRLQVSGMKSTQNKNNSPDDKKVSHFKDGIRASVLSDLNSMRTGETIYPPSKLTRQKDTKLLTNSGQGAKLKENTRLTVANQTDTREQEPLNPTLKRKNIEETSANLVLLKPTKRLFVSPGGNCFQYLRESSEKLVNKENLPDGITEKVLNNTQTSGLHFLYTVDMKELETSSDMNNDTIVESAEACAKELDNLVNMLKKTHEEAKEILVRAVINNNKLLMLNHPIYEEKFRMIEKFGALWLSK
ncbi:uncharacterized protein At4g18490-like isoform X1 [Apium graveolens]|uniref:uncharacterized protein At4g18490-like isoform X1 n=1 Tax=Apium graveolens TaxID=4045 RepID=UPI003D7B14F7